VGSVYEELVVAPYSSSLQCRCQGFVSSTYVQGVGAVAALMPWEIWQLPYLCLMPSGIPACGWGRRRSSRPALPPSGSGGALGSLAPTPRRLEAGRERAEKAEAANKEPDYLLWGCFRSSFASSSTPAGCLLELTHGLDRSALTDALQHATQRPVAGMPLVAEPVHSSRIMDYGVLCLVSCVLSW
jgi:hypothetical protein